MPFSYLILCHPLLLLLLIPPSIRVFSNESTLHMRWPTYWSFRFSIIPSKEPEKAMAPHSSTLAWKIPWMEEPGRLQSMRSLRVGQDWATSLSLFTFMHWRRKWQPTPVFLPGESRGREAWWAAISGVAQSQTRLKWLSTSKEHPGLISFRMDWLDLLEVQGTLESSPTPQFKSINSLTSIHDYWKNHSLDREAWRAAIHGVTKSWPWLSDWTELNWGYCLRLVLYWTCWGLWNGILLN